MAFDYLDRTAVRGMPFDRHQPVWQMNGAESPPPQVAGSRGTDFPPYRISP
jgi:hypothetical protein